jgi:hypothetical protein
MNSPATNPPALEATKPAAMEEAAAAAEEPKKKGACSTVLWYKIFFFFCFVFSPVPAWLTSFSRPRESRRQTLSDAPHQSTVGEEES